MNHFQRGFFFSTLWRFKPLLKNNNSWIPYKMHGSLIEQEWYWKEWLLIYHASYFMCLCYRCKLNLIPWGVLRLTGIYVGLHEACTCIYRFSTFFSLNSDICLRIFFLSKGHLIQFYIFLMLVVYCISDLTEIHWKWHFL